MKIRFSNSFEQYEARLKSSSTVYEIIDVIRENGWTKADAITNCKRPSTAVKRFFKVAGGLPYFEGWEDCILESIGNGCYKQNDFAMGDGTRNPEPSWAWELEYLGSNDWYIFLNVKM